MKNALLFVAAAFLFSACTKPTPDPQPIPAPAQAIYFPPVGSTEWATTTSESLGWNTANIQPLYNFLSAEQTRAFIVLKNGKIVLEKYFGQNITNTAPFDGASQWYWASAGKTLTSFMVGKAQQEGLLNINHKSSAYLGTGWTNEPLSKENLITVRHQLTMTTGLDDGVADVDNTTPASLQYKADAGSRWAYHNAPYTLLQKVVSAASGQPFETYFNAKLRNPIGMDGQWIANGYNHVYWSTARSMARYGLLISANSKWNGTPILNDSVYHTAMVNTSQALNPSYGYLWWLNGKSSYRAPGTQVVFPGYLTPNAPADMYAAVGKNGQLINIVPSKGLVVIRMGDNANNSQVSIGFENDLWEKLKAVVN